SPCTDPLERRNRPPLFEDTDELRSEPLAGQALGPTGGERRAFPTFRLRVKTEAEPGPVARGAEKPRRIVPKSKRMKSAQPLSPQVFPASERVDRLAEAPLRQGSGDRIDGEIPPFEIRLQRTAYAHDRQRRRIRITFLARLCQIDARAV